MRYRYKTGMDLSGDLKRMAHAARIAFDRLPKAERERRLRRHVFTAPGEISVVKVERPGLAPAVRHRLATGQAYAYSLGKES